MHLNVSLTRNIEIGAVALHGQEGLVVVPTDGGKEVRNGRTDADARKWEIALPIVDVDQDTTDYDALRALWRDSERGLHTFNFYDFEEGDTAVVRFDSERTTTAPAGHLRHVDTFTIKEVFDDVPTFSVLPSISGTTTVGNDLTVSTGTWTGSPTFTYQWLRDGVEIASATASTYTLVSGDSGKLISAYVFATVSGETTRVESAAVGPITT